MSHDVDGLCQPWGHARHIGRVLLVIGDDTEREALAAAFRGRGAAVHACDTVACARESVLLDVDAAVVDTRLRDGNGIDVLIALAKKMPRPVVIALCNGSTGREGFQLAQQGVGEVLERPFTIAEVLCAVERNDGVSLAAVAPTLVGKRRLLDAQAELRERMLAEGLARTESPTEAAKTLGVSRQAIDQAIKGPY